MIIIICPEKNGKNAKKEDKTYFAPPKSLRY